MATFLAISAALVILGGGAAAVRGVWRVWRKVSSFIDKVVGKPAEFGLPAEPGVLERMNRHEKLLVSMQHELHPNSGKSLRDVADRTEKALADHIAACNLPTGTPVQVTVNQQPSQGA